LKRVLAAALAVLVVVLLAIWKLSRSEPGGPADDSKTIATDRTASETANPPATPQKRWVHKFDERPALRAQIDELMKEREARKKEEERKCITSVSSTCPFLTPSQDVLREMAKCAVVRADMPLPPSEDSPEQATSPPELGEIDRQFWLEQGERLKSLHREIVGKRQVPETVASLLEEIQRAIPMDLTVTIHRAIARERAGLVNPPQPQELGGRPAAERFWRLRLELGDEYEDSLARKLGAERARTLRAEHDGWAGKAVFTGQCEP
jgi:hypothetical protein